MDTRLKTKTPTYIYRLPETYTPEITKDGKYATFLLRLDRCCICTRLMVTKPQALRDTFPYYFKLNFEAQAEAAGIALTSGIKVDNRPICTECAEAGKATFLCELCQKRKPTDEIEDQFGSPPEFLCVDCYETVPAKVWDEKRAELYESHEYDFC